MTLQVYQYKKDANGKYARTGNKETIGNVSRGSAGGYAPGVVAVNNPSLGVSVSSMHPTGQPSLSGPVYAPNIVPNSPPGTQTTPPTNTPGGAPNPPPQAGNMPTSSPGSPGPVTSNSNSAPASTTNQQAAIQQYIQSGGLEQSLKEKGLESGAAAGITAEDILAAQGFYGLGKAVLESALSSTLSVAEKLSLEAIGKKGSLRVLGNMEARGAQIATEEGARTIASNTPEASGLLKDVTTPLGEIAPNSKNIYQTLKQINAVSKQVKIPLMMAGGVAGVFLGAYSKSQSGHAAVDDDLTRFASSFVQDGQTLRDAGYIDEAAAIEQSAQDIHDALESGAYDNIFNGKAKGEAAINELKQRLSKGLVQVEQDKANKLKQDLIDSNNRLIEQQKASEAAAAAKLADQRAYDAQLLKDNRNYNEQKLQEQRQYDAQVNSQAAQEQAKLDATQLQTSQGSTLQFGLLGTSGATEFVDKNKAAQVYYQKNYDELTPEQKLLLNLLKGKGG